jgi:hypothetical protein
MDTLPHNGAVITLLAVTGLTHRQAYKDVFVITLTKTLAVFVVHRGILPDRDLLRRGAARRGDVIDPSQATEKTRAVANPMASAPITKPHTAAACMASSTCP